MRPSGRSYLPPLPSRSRRSLPGTCWRRTKILRQSRRTFACKPHVMPWHPASQRLEATIKLRLVNALTSLTRQDGAHASNKPQPIWLMRVIPAEEDLMCDGRVVKSLAQALTIQLSIRLTSPRPSITLTFRSFRVQPLPISVGTEGSETSLL